MQDEQDDITLDSEEGIDDSVLAEEAQGDTIKKLKEKVKNAEAKAKEHLDNWQRAQADFVNLRKRDDEAKGEFLKFAKADMISELIPVLDSFNFALNHTKNPEDITPIYSQLMQILKSNGLTEINPAEEVFDPKLAEAVSLVKTNNKEEDHTVIDVLQKGYALGDKVLRPAKVRVGEFSEKE